MKKLEKLRRLLSLVPLTYFRLQAAGNQIHSTRGLTTGMRGLLLSLDELGPTTAVRLADLRPVSRQAMHKLARQLIARGLIHQISNEEDKRAPLLQLTTKGKAELERLRIAEAPRIVALFRSLNGEDVEGAVRVLDALSTRLSPAALRAASRQVKRDTKSATR